MAADQAFLTQIADILVVDDTIASMQMINEILTKAGYMVHLIGDSQKALEAALAKPPSLILLDVKMPKMSGFEVCRRLKLDKHTQNVPVIFVGSCDELQDRIQGFEVGGVDFIYKPVQEAEVLACVKTHLQLRQTQLHLEELVAQRTAELENLIVKRSHALTSVEDQIRTLFESSTLGVSVSTFEGQLVWVNKAFLNMMRSTEADLLRRNAIELFVDPQQRVTMLEKLREDGNLMDFNLHLLRDDGSSFFVRLNSVQLFMEGREVFMAIVDDVTEQVMAEKEAAIREDRARLARDMHDAVTQTIFAASVITEAIPQIWEQDRTTGRQYLERLPVMLRGALAEMRLLLLELRPDTLREQTLGKLLELLVESMRTRIRAELNFIVEGDLKLPEDVSISLHRIVQESLNNIIKHAEARQVDIWLCSDLDGVEIRITDDGRGFNSDAIPAGSLGIGIMHERAQNIGAAIKIESRPDRGTLVVVNWPDQ